VLTTLQLSPLAGLSAIWKRSDGTDLYLCTITTQQNIDIRHDDFNKILLYKIIYILNELHNLLEIEILTRKFLLTVWWPKSRMPPDDTNHTDPYACVVIA